MIAYKAFKKGMRCRDFQYEVAKTYKVEGEVQACINGFHACENPLQTLLYYSRFFNDGIEFAKVKLGGKLDHDSYGKVAAETINVIQKCSFEDIMKTYEISVRKEYDKNILVNFGIFHGKKISLILPNNEPRVVLVGDGNKYLHSGGKYPDYLKTSSYTSWSAQDVTIHGDENTYQTNVLETNLKVHGDANVVVYRNEDDFEFRGNLLVTGRYNKFICNNNIKAVVNGDENMLVLNRPSTVKSYGINNYFDIGHEFVSLQSDFSCIVKAVEGSSVYAGNGKYKKRYEFGYEEGQLKPDHWYKLNNVREEYLTEMNKDR